MDIRVISKDIESTEAIKEYIEKRLEKLIKYFETEITAEVTLREEGKMKISQFTVNSGKNVYRSISENEDLYASFDKNVDILQRQIEKVKTIREKEKREILVFDEENDENVIENEIIKYQTYDLKPMDPEDAKLVLSEHRTNNFLTFININTGKVNVIFKLKDKKNYGLVVPE